MRGKEFDDETGEFQKGITPAYAGKSTDKAIKYLAKRDHPRVCGEKLVLCTARVRSMGSPPHVRGKVHKKF